MRLLYGTLRPGRVLKVLENGNIKAYAPGLFAEEDVETTPPVMPFFGLFSNSYSEPKKGQEIWVLNLDDNPQQLFWFRKDDHKLNNSELESLQNVEIICNREAGTGFASIYFSDGTGWIFRNGSSVIEIRADGSILLNSGMSDRIVHICPNSISLGSEGGSSHPATYADKTQDVLSQIQSALTIIRQAASTNPYTAPIANALGSTPEKIKTLIPQIQSPNVTLE